MSELGINFREMAISSIAFCKNVQVPKPGTFHPRTGGISQILISLRRPEGKGGIFVEESSSFVSSRYPYLTRCNMDKLLIGFL